MTDPGAHAVARAGLWLLAACFAGLAALLAWQHPMAPLALGMGLWVAAVVSVWRPGAWLFWLPALMPLLNFSPWTGWWLVDESLFWARTARSQHSMALLVKKSGHNSALAILWCSTKRAF